LEGGNVTIISRPALSDAPTLEVVRQSHIDVRYIPRRVGVFRRRTEWHVELRNSVFFGPNDKPEVFTIDEWIEFVETARIRVRNDWGGVSVGGFYFTKREWDLFCVGADRGAFAPPPRVHGHAA
jgi:hypothetical protein